MAQEQATKQEQVTPIATALHTIKLHEGIEGDDFEQFLLEEVFPAMNTNEDQEGEPDRHFLLGREMFGDDYVWMSRLEYWIHHHPLPNWLTQRVERQVKEAEGKLAAWGTITGSTTYYDVTGWRARLGKKQEQG